MPRSPKLTVSITVYNQEKTLRLALAALSRQSFTDFEVILADDGSGPAVKEVVAEAQRYGFPLLHLWHEDKGWRKNTMLNNVIRSASTDYLVFTDGDCIPGKDFLLDHWNEREENKVLIGRRVETSERWSKQLTIERVLSGEFEKYGMQEWWESFTGKARRVEDGLRIPSKILRTLLLRNVRGMLGSNFSVAKKHLEAINGFDELYTGPGCGEDSDPEFRLSLIGVTTKSLRNLAIQYHVWHPLTKTAQAGWDRFQEVKKRSEPRCKVGLVKEP